MKRLVLFIGALVVSAVAYAGSAFEAGWAAGYKAGKCNGQAFCSASMVPWAPFPPFGQDTFEGGYKLGFLRGMSEAR